MYLFTRAGRLASGRGPAGIAWASEISAKVESLIDQEVQLWATAYSPGIGTLTWTMWVEDLGSLESIMSKLEADESYLDLVERGAAFIEGGVDDSLVQPLHGAPDPERDIHYVAAVRAVVAGGAAERAMTIGVEIAQRAEAITGLSTMFARAMTGPYGSVSWLTGYEGLAELQSATEALEADPEWLRLVDSTDGCFVESPEATQQTLYRRLM
jgi:hypothetical protein